MTKSWLTFRWSDKDYQIKNDHDDHLFLKITQLWQNLYQGSVVAGEDDDKERSRWSLWKAPFFKNHQIWTKSLSRMVVLVERLYFLKIPKIWQQLLSGWCCSWRGFSSATCKSWQTGILTKSSTTSLQSLFKEISGLFQNRPDPKCRMERQKKKSLVI